MNKAVKWIKKAKPADWLALAEKIVPHIAIVLAGMLIVFFVIDRVNKPMGFMTNEFHKRITFVLALLAIYFAVQLIALQRRAERAEYRRRLRETQQKQPARPTTSQSARPAQPTRATQTARPTQRRSL